MLREAIYTRGQVDPSEQERYGRRRKMAIAVAALTAITVSACGTETAPTGEGSPSVSQSESVSPSSNEQSTPETDKYLRDVKIYPLSSEVQELKDRITPEIVASSTDEEVVEMFTITNDELPEYSTTKDYAEAWSEQYVALQLELEELGYLAGNEGYYDADGAREIAQHYTKLVAPTLFGKDPSTVTTDWYENVAIHNAFNKVDYEQGLVPDMQEHILQYIPDSVEVLSETDSSVTFSFRSVMDSKYDHTELWLKSTGDPEQVIEDMTFNTQVTIPKVSGNNPIIPLDFESIS